MTEIISTTKATWTLLKDVAATTQALLEHHPWIIAACFGLIAASGFGGHRYVERTRSYQDIIATTVREGGEDTPQRYKVLEAFIISTVSPRLSEKIKNASLSPRMVGYLNAADRLLRQDMQADEPRVLLSLPDYASIAHPERPQTAILTDDADTGYLFFPVSLLRKPVARDDFTAVLEESRHGYSKTLSELVADDAAIANDISISRQLLPALHNMAVSVVTEAPMASASGREPDSLPRIDLQPALVYYVTKNNVTRDVNFMAPGQQQRIYRNIYRSNAFFPGRPYYTGALEKFSNSYPTQLNNVPSRIGDAFYVTKPYLDIGGYGVVVTLARAVNYPNHSDAVLCVDLSIDVYNSAEFPLADKLRSLGGESLEVQCSLESGHIDCGEHSAGGNTDLKRAITQAVRKAMDAGDLSRMIGNIIVLDADFAPHGGNGWSIEAISDWLATRINGQPPRGLTFAIPVKLPTLVEPSMKLQFLVANLNLERHQQITALVGLCSVLLFAAAFGLVGVSWRIESRRRAGYERYFPAVDRIMYDCPTPYARVDDQDEIVDCNPAFCLMLGRNGDANSIARLKGCKFEGLLTQKSALRYGDIQNRRQNGEKVAPYRLAFRTIDHEGEVEGTVTSETITVGRKRGLPETIGIVVTTRVAGDGAEPRLQRE